jgi:hypothetical protein
MQVLEKCAEKTNPLIQKYRSGKFKLRSHDLNDAVVFVEAETLTLAICLFAKQLYSK